MVVNNPNVTFFSQTGGGEGGGAQGSHSCRRCIKHLFTLSQHAGALAGLMQGPRATSLTDGLNRPQMSYSLPAQLPDPDQHMHEVYLAAQAAAAAAAAGNITQVGVFLVTTLHRFILQNQSTLLYRVLN